MYEWPADKFWINTSCSGVDFDFGEPEWRLFISIGVWRVALYTTAPVALSATIITNDCVIPPSNPGVHWRWKVSLDLFITVQFSTGSGATEINKDINAIQKTMLEWRCLTRLNGYQFAIEFIFTIYYKLHNSTICFNIKDYYTFNIVIFLYATNDFTYFCTFYRKLQMWSFYSNPIYIFAAPIVVKLSQII